MRLLQALGLCVSLLAATGPTFAQEGVPVLTQGEFAMILVQAAEAEGLLPPAATIRDAIALLKDLGLEPEGGWDPQAEMSMEDIRSLLGPEYEADVPLSEMVEALSERIASLLWARTGGAEAVSPIAPS